MWSGRWLSQEARSVMALTGTHNPVVGIKLLAADLVDETGLAKPPFSPAILASFQNVSEIRVKHMTSAARLIPDPETRTLVIEVNADHSQGKRNFSVDHETVHTLIPTYSRKLVDDAETGRFSTNSEEELLCDIGASALLLDDRWLIPLARTYGPSLYTLFHLAELFDASLEATARKLAELDLWPCAFVFWEEGFRKGESVGEGQMPISTLELFGLPQPKLRVKRPYVARSFGIYVPENKSVEHTSLVAMCCEGEPFTSGFEHFDFGRCQEYLYCESAHVPYRSRGTIHRRVLSLLIRTRADTSSFTIPELFLLEDL